MSFETGDQCEARLSTRHVLVEYLPVPGRDVLRPIFRVPFFTCQSLRQDDVADFLLLRVYRSKLPLQIGERFKCALVARGCELFQEDQDEFNRAVLLWLPGAVRVCVMLLQQHTLCCRLTPFGALRSPSVFLPFGPQPTSLRRIFIDKFRTLRCWFKSGEAELVTSRRTKPPISGTNQVAVRLSLIRASISSNVRPGRER